MRYLSLAPRSQRSPDSVALTSRASPSKIKLIQTITDLSYVIFNPPLLQVLKATRSSVATDARDSIYAKLALAGESLSIVPEPSYGEDVVTVFERVAKVYIICLASPIYLQGRKLSLRLDLSVERISLISAKMPSSGWQRIRV